MNCDQISELAPLYLTKELDDEREAAFTAHLRGCPQCRQELAEQTAFDERLRAGVLAEPVDAAPLESRVRDAIHRDRPNWRIRARVAAVVAAALLIAAVAYREMIPAQPDPLDAAAALDHHMEIVDRQPRPWLTDRAAIEELAVQQGLQSSVLSALAPAGYHVTQGKLCFLNGHIFLHLVFENESGNASLFLRRLETPATSDIHTDNLAADYVAGFQHGRLTAIVVTDQPGQTVLNLARSAATVL